MQPPAILLLRSRECLRHHLHRLQHSFERFNMSRKRAQSRPPASPSSADEDSDRAVGGGAADDDIPDGFREMVDCLVAVKLRKTPDANEKVFLASFLKQAHSLKSARAITFGFIDPVLAALGRNLTEDLIKKPVEDQTVEELPPDDHDDRACRGCAFGPLAFREARRAGPRTVPESDAFLWQLLCRRRQCKCWRDEDAEHRLPGRKGKLPRPKQ